MTIVLKKTLQFLFFSCMLFMIAQSSTGMEKTTVLGVLNDNYQVVNDEGEKYLIGDTEKGIEMESLVGSRVEVFGEVFETDGELYINVEEFLVIKPSTE